MKLDSFAAGCDGQTLGLPPCQRSYSNQQYDLQSEMSAQRGKEVVTCVQSSERVARLQAVARSFLVRRRLKRWRGDLASASRGTAGGTSIVSPRFPDSDGRTAGVGYGHVALFLAREQKASRLLQVYKSSNLLTNIRNEVLRSPCR